MCWSTRGGTAYRGKKRNYLDGLTAGNTLLQVNNFKIPYLTCVLMLHKLTEEQRSNFLFLVKWGPNRHTIGIPMIDSTYRIKTIAETSNNNQRKL